MSRSDAVCLSQNASTSCSATMSAPDRRRKPRTSPAARFSSSRFKDTARRRAPSAGMAAWWLGSRNQACRIAAAKAEDAVRHCRASTATTASRRAPMARCWRPKLRRSRSQPYRPSSESRLKAAARMAIMASRRANGRAGFDATGIGPSPDLGFPTWPSSTGSLSVIAPHAASLRGRKPAASDA